MKPEVTFYDLEELSKILHVTRRTLQTYVKDGRLKAVKLGRKWVVSEDNLRAFLNGE